MCVFVSCVGGAGSREWGEERSGERNGRGRVESGESLVFETGINSTPTGFVCLYWLCARGLVCALYEYCCTRMVIYTYTVIRVCVVNINNIPQFVIWEFSKSSIIRTVFFLMKTRDLPGGWPKTPRRLFRMLPLLTQELSEQFSYSPESVVG